MKKFIYILSVFIMAFSLAACAPDGMPPEDDSLPAIDIVERSELLDMVTVDHLFSDKDKQLMADMGVSVSLDDFELTADDRAEFTLFFKTKTDTFKYTAQAVIDYTAMADGSFEDIRFYWGGLTKAGDNLMVASLYDYAVLPLDGKTKELTTVQLDFIKENDGYIVHTAYGFDKYAVMYYSEQQAGIAVYDNNGNLISNLTEKIERTGIVNMFGTHTEKLISDIPFSYNDKFYGFFVSKDLFMTDLRFEYERYSLYNCADNTVSMTVSSWVQPLTVGNITYFVYQDHSGDYDKGYTGLALCKQNDEYIGCITYDTKGYTFEKRNNGTLLLDDNGNLVYNSLPTGLQFVFDFKNNSYTNDYHITEEMLGDRLAQSKDKNYSIYEYSKHSHNSHSVSYIALKNEKTDEISFISAYKGRPYRDHILETGFFSNGEIYLMTDYDFAVYSPEDTEKGPVLNLGEKFPLGIDGPEYLKYNTLWAVRRDPVDKSFVVVYDHLHHAYLYTPPLSEDENFCADTYDIAILDKEGNIIKTFATPMPVPVNTNVLNISLSGDILTMENLTRDTGKTIQKATLNIKTGKYKKVL